MNNSNKIIKQLTRIADALDRMVPPLKSNQFLKNSNTYEWFAKEQILNPIKEVNRVKLDLLLGINKNKEIIIQNTLQFANNLPANNVLLWGARGMGKSSLVKAVHLYVRNFTQNDLILIEIHKNEIDSLPNLIRLLSNEKKQFIIFCDDLSFEYGEQTYKALKSLLDGGIEKKSDNILFYATSNRRHLIARNIVENEKQNAIHESEVVEEKISLSDRFGISLGFYSCSQKDYYTIVKAYSEEYKLNISNQDLEQLSIKWSIARGSRSGRVAWQFIQDLAGKLEQKLKP